MSMAPFGARPVLRGSERSRARLALVLATVGIAAALVAYAASPGVRHAVSHAAHSVKHAVGNVFDRDTNERGHRKTPTRAKRGSVKARTPLTRLAHSQRPKPSASPQRPAGP
jgi:hypothetical protein